MQDIVNAICDDDDIRAISFVGSNTVSYFVLTSRLCFTIVISSFHELGTP